MKKVFIGVGHGGTDSGAIGIVTEKTVNLEMGIACRDYLIKHGIEVKMSREKDENDTVMQEIKECNEFNPDLAIDIHNNSGGGDGFEAFYHFKGGTSKTLALNIEKEVKALGQNSRSCKCRTSNGKDYYAFIRETICPAVICEGFFVDNPSDAKIGDEINEQRNFGIAYAKGILKTLNIPLINDEKKLIYRVQVGAFSNPNNAEALVIKLNNYGFPGAFIVKS